MEIVTRLADVHKTITVVDSQKEITEFKAIDGKIYSTEEKCFAHEKHLTWQAEFNSIEQAKLRIDLTDFSYSNDGASYWYKTKDQRQMELILNNMRNHSYRPAFIFNDERIFSSENHKNVHDDDKIWKEQRLTTLINTIPEYLVYI